METLAIDIETYSDIDIGLGVYRYSESPNFKVLLFAYQVDAGPVELIDLTETDPPGWILEALEDEAIKKTAYHAQFERVCLNRFFGISSKNWDCTMIKAWGAGFQGGLATVSTALGVSEEEGKKKEGQRLIRMFSVPQRRTKRRPSTAPYTKEEAPEDWESFKDYCVRDVEVEGFIRRKLEYFIVEPKEEFDLYRLDQKINDRGIAIDLDMAKNAIRIIDGQTEKYTNRFRDVTGIDSPTKLAQLKAWLSTRSGVTIDAITKGNQAELYELFKDDKDALIALDCRYQTGKTSTAKYQMMLDATGLDGRMRGTLQFYGAQTGRWAGRLLQVQNLPRNRVSDLETARRIVKHTDFEFLEMCYSKPADILSQCIRPAIVPSPGKKFIVSDFSAIEARVLAWVAGQKDVVEVFKGHGMIYEATASSMFKLGGVEDFDWKSPEGQEMRQRGKVATLACGYQGGAGSLISMGALKMGIPEEDLQSIVDAWRASNGYIVQFWYDIENAAKTCVKERTAVDVRGISLFYVNNSLFIRLPSGRRLAYPKIKLVPSDKFIGQDQLVYGVVKSGGSWHAQETYGGRLVENIVQAIARDCLAHSMLRLDEEGFDIVMHVHDEVVVEVDREDETALERVVDIMSEAISWAKGLPLSAAAFECNYYQKD